MIRLRILVVHEPRVSRESLIAALAELRPETEVRATDPAELDGSVATMRPHLVLCSRLTTAVEAILAWVFLYPDGANRVEVGVDGERQTLNDLGLDGLLAVVDRIAGLAQMSQTKVVHPRAGASRSSM